MYENASTGNYDHLTDKLDILPLFSLKYLHSESYDIDIFKVKIVSKQNCSILIWYHLGVQKSYNVPWPMWLSWLEHHPINRKVMGSIPSQSTCLGCGFNLSLSVSLSLSPHHWPLESINISLGEDLKKKELQCYSEFVGFIYTPGYVYIHKCRWMDG